MEPDIFERPHYNVHQLRTDIWNELKHAAYRLQSGRRPKAAFEDPKARIEKLLKLLWSIERFFAYPGLDTLSHFQSMLKRGEHKALATLVADVVKMMISSAYRSNPRSITINH